MPFDTHNSLSVYECSHFPPFHLHLHLNVCQPDKCIVLICISLVIGDFEHLFNSSAWLLQSLLTLYVPARLSAPEGGTGSHILGPHRARPAPSKHTFSSYLSHLTTVPHFEALPSEVNKPPPAPQIHPTGFVFTLCPLSGPRCLFQST